MSTFSQHLPVGFSLGSYKITAKIGEGGMGEVYEALDERLNRFAVIKVISKRATLAMGDKAVQNFMREAQALGRINHPNVVTVYSVDKIADVHFIAMERVVGADLRWPFENLIFSASEAATLLLQMLEGLEALHQSGLIHRDLKPANLILNLKGQIKILDFGVAKFMDDKKKNKGPKMFEGTLAYAAPELAAGATASVRSDLWSLGAIFFEAMVGRRVIERDQHASLGEALRYVKKVEAKIPSDCEPWVPAPAVELLEKLCARRINARFSSAGEAILAVKAFLARYPVAKPTSFLAAARPLSEIKPAQNQIAARGFTGMQVRRILTLAAACELEAHPEPERKGVDAGFDRAQSALRLSEAAVAQGVMRYNKDLNVLREIESRLSQKAVKPRLDSDSVRQVALGLGAALSLGLLIWQHFSLSQRHLTPAPVPAPAIATLPTRVSTSESNRPAATLARAPAAPTIAVLAYRDFAIESTSLTNPSTLGPLMHSLQRQLDLVAAANLSPAFTDYMHSVHLVVVPGYKGNPLLKEGRTIQVGEVPLDPTKPLLLVEYMKLFAQTASPDLFAETKLKALFQSAHATDLLAKADFKPQDEQEYFAYLATAFLLNNTTLPPYSRENIRRMQPQALPFLKALLLSQNGGHSFAPRR